MDNWTKSDWRVFQKTISQSTVRQHIVKTGRRPDKPNHNWIAVDGLPGAMNCKCSRCGMKYMKSFEGDWCESL